ncbi:hypothetical protein LCGC14_1900470 [marine sediment metagenome]|uniref:4Fe-4S ferredoxin-type domain-containing protein n=1 Tax=marine sediment metagenome TaxID=412755 RepID=A0A0F9IUV5_9ZZZZ
MTKKEQQRHVIERDSLESLFDVLRHKGFDIVGPTVEDNAICYSSIDSSKDLPVGWTDVQSEGKYRIKKRQDNALFGYVVGPTSWKKFLFPPRIKLWEAKKSQKDFDIVENTDEVPSYAFLSVRACELQAIAIQDKIFLKGDHIDPIYKKRREKTLIIAVNCTEPKGTCFCVSMNTGPRASFGFDLSLTEIIEDEKHYFVVEVGSSKGEKILKDVSHRPVESSEIERQNKLLEKAEREMGRVMDTQNIKELLYKNMEHPQWGDVAKRCLSCANCTLVCPTCFCSNVEDVTDLTGDHAQRVRTWDSCFTAEHSYIHGGNIRSSIKSRYRQWMTHKLASWQDQFDSSGCVGCGRCITWCPVGIDITKEVKAIEDIPPADVERE